MADPLVEGAHPLLAFLRRLVVLPGRLPWTSRGSGVPEDGPLTFPFAWRPALGRDGALLGSLTRIFEQTVQGFYAGRAREEGQLGAKTGSVTVLQRVSSDLRLNPHVHSVFLSLK